MEEGDCRMSSVDDRIVNMQFNNSQFQTGAADSTKSLQTLEQTIAGMGTGTGLTTMGQNVDGIRAKFSALQVAGVTALATIVNKAVNAGLALIKSMTLDPLLQGFQEYETNLNSIQTIMANTGAGVKEVGVYLDELNRYSDKTIYNFSQMAQNIGRFTAAGVELREATDAIKGLANTAALSGSSVEQLNTAMYQMSQALSTGTIRLMDWNSLANAGMGGENIQEALKATAETTNDAGAAMKAAVQEAGNFRESLASGWLSADIFSKTMKVMAGQTLKAKDTANLTAKELEKLGWTGKKAGDTVAFTVEQLKKMGYSTEAATELNRLSQAAIDSATKVKTFSQLIDVVKESIGSGWAKVFENLFGNFTQASKLWTGVSESITGVVSNIFKGVNKMLVGWRKLGGYQELWNGFKNIFTAIGNIIGPVVAAFQSLSPSTDQAGSGLHTLTSGFETFTGWLVAITDKLDYLTPVLAAVGGAFRYISGIVATMIRDLAPVGDVIKNFASDIGDMTKEGLDVGRSFVDGILEGIGVNDIKATIENFASSIVDWIKGALGIASPAAELIPVGMAIVEGIVQGITSAIKFIGEAMGKIATAVLDGISQLFGGFDALDWTALFNAILTGGLVVIVANMMKQFKSLAKALEDFTVGIGEPFSQLTSTLKTMQQELRARMLMDIAIAVGILAASLIALSLIGMEKLKVGLSGLAGILGLLVGALLGLSKIPPQGLFAMGAAISEISVAIFILTASIAALGALPMDVLAQGLGGVAAALAIFVIALKKMPANTAGLVTAASAILIMSTAMLILAAAVTALGKLDPAELARGLTGVAAGLTLFVVALAALSIIGGRALVAAEALIIVSSAIAIFAASLFVIGKMNMGDLAQGLAAIGFGLVGMVVALGVVSAMGPQVIVAANAIVLMASAMAILAGALTIVGQLSLAQLATGILGLASALSVLLLAAAGAEFVAAGLAVLDATFVSIGIGVALIGAGLLAAATAFSIFAAVGVAGIGVLVAGFTAFMALLPALAVQLATAFVTFAKTIAAAAPELREAFGTIIREALGTLEDAIPEIQSLTNALIGMLLDILEKNVPKVQKVFMAYVRAMLATLREAIPLMARTGYQIILGLLQALSDYLPKIIRAGTDIIVSLITGIGNAAERIVTAAGNAMLKFLHGVNDWLSDNHEDFITTGKSIAGYILEGLTFGLSDNIGDVLGAAGDLVGKIKDVFSFGFSFGSPSKVAIQWGQWIVEGLANGISSSIETAVGATVQFVNAVVAAGDNVIRKFQREAAKKQIAADRAAAKAKVSDQMAREAEKIAKQNPKNKALQKAAEDARKQADKDAKAAQAAQKAADAAAQRVSSKQEFRSADAQGKGDILTAQATALSERAVKALALANAEAQAAKKLRGKERDDMLRAAREDAQKARELAKKSKQAQQDAATYYAQSVKDRLKAIRDAQALEAKQLKDQEEFDMATNTEKAAILQTRAEAAQKRATDAQKKSDDLLKAARKLAKKDAAKAQHLIDRAERLAQEAKDAAEEAKKDQEDAQGYLTQGSTTTSGGSGFSLSRTAMEDAASAIDRYTKSLQQAEEAAAATTPVYQFVQNNNSPESLSDTEVYRQTKNLLSAAEVKMGVNA
jgi:tape measure domain-containing protein